MDLFKYADYRAFVADWEKTESDRGSRTRMAQAARCSPSWMTRVLNGNVQLTPDQAMGIAGYFHLNEPETDFFLLLVDLERASTLELKKRIQRKMDALKKESRKIAAAVKSDVTVSEEFAVRYYSSWIYPAVHVACMVKAQTPEEITALLNLSPTVIAKTLKLLREMRLLRLDGSRWLANSTSVHLPSDHPIAKVTHASWRNRTIQFLQEGNDDGLHYSAVHCLSKSDLETVRRALKEAILNCRKTIEDSPSEALAVLCVDWYEL